MIWGLSPRVRGNLLGSGEDPAGGRVYPRVCGGTTVARVSTSNVTGLSPRVRGNLLRSSHTPMDVGSIPACAGEPLGDSPSRSRAGQGGLGFVLLGWLGV